MPGDASPILKAARTALDGPRKLPCRAECFLQFDALAMNRLDSGVFEEAAKRACVTSRSVMRPLMRLPATPVPPTQAAAAAGLGLCHGPRDRSAFDERCRGAGAHILRRS
jgi:hypothetical protein